MSDATTVTVNGSGLVLDCLASLALQALDGLSTVAIMVDNDSHDGAAELDDRHYPGVRAIRSCSNVSFAARSDLPLAQVDSAAVVMVNNDATPGPGSARSLVRHLARSAPTVSAVAARVVLDQRFHRAAKGEEHAFAIRPDGRWVSNSHTDHRTIPATGNEMRVDGFGLDRGWLAQASQHHPSKHVFGLGGAAAVPRTAALDDVGQVDEQLFKYCEDADLSWRLGLQGWRVASCESTEVCRIHSTATGGSDFFRFHDLRNRLLVETKNASLAFAVRTVGQALLTFGSSALLRRRPGPVTRVRLAAIASLLRWRSSASPSISCCSSGHPRKNPIALVEANAAARAVDPDHTPFVLFGPAGRAEGADPPGVLRTGWPDYVVFQDLVAASSGLVLSSLDEGFALPVIEAMACVHPVLTSDLPELACDQALSPEPSVEALTDGLAKLAAAPDDNAAPVALRAWAARLTWDATAEGTAAVA